MALWAAAVFAIATFAFWIWMLFIYDPGLLIDELSERKFPTEAEQVCAQTVDRIALLPAAQTARTSTERAEVVDQANADLSVMVAQLGPLAPSEPAEEREAVEEWLGDWAAYLKDRAAYAEALKKDSDARFTEGVKGSRQVSRAIDSFAEVNRMPSCATPGDVG